MQRMDSNIFPDKAGMVGWAGEFETGKRPCGIHPLASIGGPPEYQKRWMVGDETLEPDIHETALIHAFCTVDAGMPDMRTTTIGPRSFLQARVHVGHNAVIGADCQLCVGAVICGEVQVGDGVFIGGNTWVKPKVRLGDGAHIGGGSVVTNDIPAHEVWCGSPAKFLKLADTHPWKIEPRETTDTDHPYRDPDYVWDLMRPWHHRETAA